MATTPSSARVSLNFYDGTIQGAGTLNTLPGGTINWFDGSATGTGKISVSGSGSILHIAGPLALNGFSLDNFSTVSWDSGDITTAAGTIISNQPGATFAAFSDNALTGAGTFNNSGLFSKLLGAQQGKTRIAVAFNNKTAPGQSAAEVHAIQGAISLEGAGTHDSLFNAPVGGSIDFVGFTSVQVVQDGARFTGMGGTYLSSNAAINVVGTDVQNDGRFLFSRRVFALQPPTGGVMMGTGTFTNTNLVVWEVGGLNSLNEFENADTATIQFATGSPKSIRNSHLTNNGTITWLDGNIDMSVGAQIENRQLALFDVRTDATMVNFDGYISVGLLNLGTFRKTAGNGVTTIQVVYQQPAGAFLMNGLNMTFTRDLLQTGGETRMGNNINGAGTLTVNGKYDLFGGSLSIDEGTLTVGNGLVVQGADVTNASGTVNGNVTNSGRFYIGKASRISNLDIFGDFTQLSGGTLHFEVSTAGGVPSYDYLDIDGVFTAGGTLTVSSMAFTPAIGQQFILIEFLVALEDFSTITLPDLPAPRQWKQQKWFDNDFTLEVE